MSALFVSYDADLDWLEAAPFGVVMDRQGPDRWRGVCEAFGWFLDRPDGGVVGFKVKDLATIDPYDPELAEVFGGPRFDFPAMGLRAVSAGQMLLAAPAFLRGQSTIDRQFFAAAMEETGERAVALWVAALQAGNCMAHYGAGYSLLDLGDGHAAYRHLRAYTELVPADAWAWAFRARAAVAIGEVAEAATCCHRAIRLEELHGEQTDAADLLAELAQE